MPEEFWIEEYRRKAASESTIEQTGRGSKFDAYEFCYVARQVLDILKLERWHDVLDLGSANGLIDILISGCCKSVLAVDPVEELVALAVENTKDCHNVKAVVGDGAKIPSGEAVFDRVLVWGVIQLIGKVECRKMFSELRRVSKSNCRILIGSIPDARHRDLFLDTYIDGVRKAGHLSEYRKQEIIERNINSHWYTAEELASWWIDSGGIKVEEIPLAPSDPNYKERFHLLLY